MKKLRWQIVIILITGLVVGALLLRQQPITLHTAKPEPTTGGSYTEALIGSMKRLNPLLDQYNPADQDVDRLIFSSLVRFDSHGQPQPDLAESWGISQDATTYNFALRKDIFWQDGQPLTADDVVFTLDLLRTETPLIPADLQAFWKEVEIKQIDERTLQFRLPEAFAPFLDYLSVGILPKHLLGTLSFDQIVDASFNLKPVGSGPYALDHLIVENSQIKGVALKSNEKYYGKKPYIPQVSFLYYPDGASAFAAYQKNEVQGLSRVTNDVLPQALADPDLGIYTGREPELAMVLFNLDNNDVPFFQDVEVRQALMTGLNRQRLVDRVLQGQAILANGPLFPGTWASADSLSPAPFDTQKAVAQLKEAGYSLPTEGEAVMVKEDKPLSFQLSYPDGDSYRGIAEAIQQDWQALGIKVTLEALPYDQLISDRLAGRNFQAALVELNMQGRPDPDPYPFWDQSQTPNGENYTQWDNKTASEYLEQARITRDTGERARLYRNFQAIFLKDMPAIPLYYPVYTYAVDHQIQGNQMGALFQPSDRFATLDDWFLVAKRPTEPTTQPTNTP